VELLNDYFEVMVEVLCQFDGTLDKYVGDELMALFGVPVDQPDAAVAAVQCAVEMQNAIKEFNRHRMAEGQSPVHSGIGINTGEVVYGAIGSSKRTKYSILGSNVNLAARIESYSVGGQILASSSTVAACGPILRIDGEMEVLPKGLQRPITIYEVGGIGGEYDLNLTPREQAMLHPLPAPVPVQAVVLDGKQADGMHHPGRLLRLGDEGAELECAAETELLADIKLSLEDTPDAWVAGDIYCKVAGRQPKDPGRVRVRFTSVPPEMAEHLRRLRASGAPGEAK